MNINFHIDRLVLDGLPIDSHQGALVKAAVEMELTRLLARGDLSERSMTAGAMAAAPAPAPRIQVSSGSKPARIGQQIGQAVFRSLRK